MIARNQITLWGPNGEIKDYANKQWAGKTIYLTLILSMKCFCIIREEEVDIFYKLFLFLLTNVLN